jgi:hypothetical protein
MIDNESQPNPLDEFEPWRVGESHDSFVERARAHHARTGDWPPDPLLDEVAEMRRRVMAEHGNDYRKVLQWYVDMDEQAAAQEAEPESVPDPSAGVSRP